jgi:hypothetical protein
MAQSSSRPSQSDRFNGHRPVEPVPMSMASTAAAPASPDTAETRRVARSFAIPRSLWPLVAVGAVYVLAAFVVPTLAPVAISDDWTYTRSVEYLVWEGKFHVLSVAAATQVTQLFWGALFAEIFGVTFGALRLSTVVLVGVSGLAFYGLCRELRVSRERSALGTAVYLFNPILFPITYSFMSDPHFLALLVGAAYGYARGLRPGIAGERATLLASVVAALACLQRPHGALIPLGVVTYLVLARRLRFDRASIASFLRIVAIPAATFVGYYLLVSRGLPHQQGLFLDEAEAAGVGQTWLLVRRLTVIELVYAGLFVFPIAAALVPALGTLTRLTRLRQWLVVLVWEAVLVGGVVWFGDEGKWMPYIPHFLGRSGPGSGDLRAARPSLAGTDAFAVATLVFAAASLVLALALARSLGRAPGPDRSAVGLVLALGAWQMVGVVPPSLLFRNWVISLDRYILPLVPFTIWLALWAVNDVRLSPTIAWTVTGLTALFSIAGTRDAIVFQEQIWSLARGLNAAGVANTSLDAGYAWDAYHLWEYSQANGIPERQQSGSWWTDVYAPATDSTYVIAGEPLPGYAVLSQHPYSSWLQTKPTSLYVLQWQEPPPQPQE